MKRDALIALAGGYLGSRVMDWVTAQLQMMASTADKQQEEAVSPGVAYEVAARRISQQLGVELSDDGVKTVGAGFHQGIGLSAGIMYVALRHSTPLGPVTAGLLVAMVLWVGVDELANSIFGFSAPLNRYPIGTHVRGFAGHVALGFATAISVEILSKALGRTQAA